MSDAENSRKERVESNAVVGLSKDVFSCNFQVTTSASILLDDCERAYDYLKHAETRLQHAESSFDLGDCIINVKRAIDHRIRRLHKAHGLGCLPELPQAPHGALEFLGIMRPVMAKELYNLRNRVEHEFFDALSKEQCERWAEFVWYFLRSTDSCLKWRPSNIRFARSDEYWIELSRREVDDWDIRVRGWVRSNEINPKIVGNALSVKIDRLLDAASALKMLAPVIRGSWERPSADDVYIDGTILGVSKSPQLMNIFVENRDLEELFEFVLR